VSRPARRPPRRPVNAAACALRALERLGRPSSARAVARVAGYTERRLRTVLPQLAARGLVVRLQTPRQAVWWLP